MQLTEEQTEAVAAMRASVMKHQNFVLAGYAGTGKTVTISALVKTLENVAVIAPTGKAAQVLRKKGIKSAQTIHSLIYEKVSDKPLRFQQRQKISASVLVVDEASMVSKEVYYDLLRYGKPIVFVGDSFQLPPVGNSIDMFAKPNFTLNQVHRTALDNPIIQLATWLRTSQRHWCYFFVKFQADDKLTLLRRNQLKQIESTHSQIICGRNDTRRRINQRIRSQLFQSPPHLPIPGDRVICLRNNRNLNIFNGQQFKVLSSSNGVYKLLDEEETEIDVPIFEHGFRGVAYDQCPKTLNPFDYSYAITCHKSQGSEWQDVFIVDEAFGTNPNRWRYTALTRAQEKATIYIP